MKISFCTTCKGRRSDLEKTLPRNLLDNVRSNAEFVVLDYASDDGVGDWLKEKYSAQILTGFLVYYRAAGQKFFHMAHAKNCAHRLATGDILCNLDADNFTGGRFVDHIYEQFEAGFELLFSTTGTGSHGRVVISRDRFFALGGYDEHLCGYGWDDNDLTARARAAGAKATELPRDFLNCLASSDPTLLYPAELKDKQRSEAVNRACSEWNLKQGTLVANHGRPWGNIIVQKNFGAYLEV